MTQYLLSIYQPDGGPPPPEVLDPIMRDARRARPRRCTTPACGSSRPACTRRSTATVVRAEDDDVLLTDGPYVEGKEHSAGSRSSRRPTSTRRSTGAASWPACWHRCRSRSGRSDVRVT